MAFPDEYYMEKLTLTTDYVALKCCEVVIECVMEDIAIKAQVYQKIVQVVSDKSILATNTSAIPINKLQMLVANPERFLGIHWAEPATMTRFLEVICGDLTAQHCAAFILKLATCWDKEPTLLKKDIRGFIANRLMYAVYREIFHLIETGKATKEDADKVFRYDMGSWMTLMGIFRRIDYMGIKDFAVAMSNTFPQLSNSREVPQMMEDMVEKSARGIYNGVGLYAYTMDECKDWETAYTAFSKEIYMLAKEYSSAQINQMLKIE